MAACLRFVRWAMAAITFSCFLPLDAGAAAIEDCNKLRGTAAISACTQVVDDEGATQPNRVLARLLRARAALDMSDLERAEEDINAALLAQPQSTFAYRLRARLRGLQGKDAEALADLTSAVQMPQSPGSKYVSHLDRGYYFARHMEPLQALGDFNAAVRIDSTKAAAFVGRAIVAKSAGDIAGALLDLDQAKTIEPNFKLTYLERGDILLAEKRFAEAIADYDIALGLDRGDARAVKGRAAAIALAAASGVDVSTKPVVTLVVPPAPQPSAPAAPPSTATPAPGSPQPSGPSTAAPAPPPPSPPEPLPSSDAPATTPPQSPPPTTTSVPAAPPAAEDPKPASQAGEARQEKLKEALKLRQSGKHKEALAIYEELLRAAPADTELAVEKGRTLVSLERWKEALDTLKPVIEGKTVPANMKALAFEAQGEVLARNDRFEPAILSLTAALQINPKLLNALFWRGYCSYLIGAFEASLVDFQQASSIGTKSSLYPGWEALALVSIGDLPKAQQAIERTLAIQSDSTIALTARARLKLVNGELDSAEADLAQLARRGPLGTVALQTQQLIMINKIFKPRDPATTAPKQ